jgi:DNA-binding transcriptional MerR regulator
MSYCLGMESETLSIGELADEAGLSQRAIRFYVQQKLLPPPLGRGRGRHYDRRHLELLRKVIALQQGGHSLHAIRQVLDASRDREGAVDHPEPVAVSSPLVSPPPAVLSAELWTRLKIGDGIELSFDTTRFNPTVEQLLALRQMIRETLV